MRYQIFIPNAGGANVENLRKVGLDDLLAPHDERPSCADVLKGPDGAHGQLWGWPGALDVLSFNPATHVATPCVADPVRGLPAGRFYWVFAKDSPPTIEDLTRERTFTGYLVTLGDGRQWNVPNVLELPETFGYDEAGNVVKVARKEWRPFVDDAEWALHQCSVAIGADGAREWKRELDVAARFLSANYRVNRELLMKLELVEPHTVIEVLLRAIDRDRLTRLVESLKNPMAGPATPAGSGV